MSHTILVTGGAGYIGSHVCKALAEAGHQPDLLRHAGERPRLGRALGPARARRHRRRGASRRRVRPPPSERRDPSRGLHRGRRIGEPARTLSAQQRGQVRCPDRSRAAPRRRCLGVFQHLRRLRPAANGPADGDPSLSHRSAPMPSPRRGSSARWPPPPAAVCVRRRCAISMPPAPMPMARSARRIIPRPICCRSPPTPLSASAPPSPCWARTIRRLTVRASATSCM